MAMADKKTDSNNVRFDPGAEEHGVKNVGQLGGGFRLPIRRNMLQKATGGHVTPPLEEELSLTNQSEDKPQ